jgi:hypothetical protein
VQSDDKTVEKHKESIVSVDLFACHHRHVLHPCREQQPVEERQKQKKDRKQMREKIKQMGRGFKEKVVPAI